MMSVKSFPRSEWKPLYQNLVDGFEGKPFLAKGKFSTTKPSPVSFLPPPAVPIGTCYQLTQEETDLCIKIGRLRCSTNRKNSIFDAKYSQRDSEDLSIQGVFGEFAMAKLFNMPIELHDTHSRGVMTDHGKDGTLFNGWKVDVKTTIYDDADIRVTTNKARNPPDCYALMIQTNSEGKYVLIRPDLLPILSFRGFAKASTVFDTKNLELIGPKSTPYYILPQKYLQPLENLIN